MAAPSLPLTPSFPAIAAQTIKIEGGFVDNPQDPGGATNLGVTQRVLDAMRREHPDWMLPPSVADLAEPQAVLIYRTYWDAIRGDALPTPLASCVFKQAINQGATRAIIELQMSLGVALDGNLGPVTIAAANRKDALDGVVDFIACAELNYARSADFPLFGKGWFRRATRTAIQAFS